MKAGRHIRSVFSSSMLRWFDMCTLPKFFLVLVCAANLLFLAASASAQFVVRPMVIDQTMAPGESSKTTLRLENPGKDRVQASIETVDLAKDQNGQWVLLEGAEQDHEDLVMVPSCRTWLSWERRETDFINIGAENTVPLDLRIQVPAEAKGSYRAGAKITVGPIVSEGVFVRYAFVVPVMLEIEGAGPEDPGQAQQPEQPLESGCPSQGQPEKKQLGPAQNKPSIVSGVCINASGERISDARVLLFEQDHGAGTWVLLAEGSTDADGQFSLQLHMQPDEEDDPHKTHTVFVPANGHGPAWQRIGPNASSLELVAYEPTLITGHVLSEVSKPVAGARVWIRQVTLPKEASEGPKAYLKDLYCPTPLPGWSCRTDEKGAFHIAGVSNKARINLIVSHPDFAEGIAYVQAGTDIDIKLLPAAVIEGRVLNEKKGMPGVGVRVQAQAVEDVQVLGGSTIPWATAITDAQGRYRLTSLIANKYNIWAKAEGLTVVALESFAVETGQVREAPDLQLLEGGFIIGRVIDEKTGQPIRPGQLSDVAIYGPSRPKSGAAVESSRICEDGSFRIRVAPGRNYIYLRPREAWRRGQAVVTPPHHWVTVESGQTIEVEFRIRHLSEGQREKVDPYIVPILPLDEAKIRRL